MCDMFIFCLELYNYCVLIITYLLLYAANYGELVATLSLAYSLATAYIVTSYYFQYASWVHTYFHTV